jgi:hypothetical protein
MDRSKGRFMATTEESLCELLDQLNTRTIEDPRMSDWSWQGQPIEPFTSHSIGTSDPYYGAVPSVTVSGSNVSTPVWTTTTNNTGAYTFANQNIQPNNTVHIKGENADLLINDKSLKTWMEKVEERLNILTPNPEIEKEWDNLKKLGDRYRKLEQKCREKTDVWKKLKSMPKPEIR